MRGIGGGTLSMPRVICVTGFLGAGKTTLLNAILPACLKKGKAAVIENDFGDATVDAEILAETGATIRELASGCICCSLKGTLRETLADLLEKERPDHVFVEPSGIGRPSDLLPALADAGGGNAPARVNVVTLVDAGNFDGYLDVFGDFFGDQIAAGDLVLFSHQENMNDADKRRIARAIGNLNGTADIYAGDWRELDGETLLEMILGASPRHHDAGGAGRDGQHRHGPSGARVFSSWHGVPAKEFTKSEMEAALSRLSEGIAGEVLRAKGFCPDGEGGSWHFEFLPGHNCVEASELSAAPRALVVGRELREAALAELFG